MGFERIHQNMERLFLTNSKGMIKNVYTSEQIGSFPILSFDELEANRDLVKDTRFIFSTWGMPSMTEAQIDYYFPALEVVFYGAGSVQGFARSFLNKNIRVFSAWAANAVPVAEFAVSQIILANKGYFQLHRRYSQSHRESVEYANTFPGNYGVQVGLLGAGMIGKYVIGLLKPYNVKIKVFDPFLSDEKAKELGVEKTTLEDIFANCQTISNHLANNAQTKGMLDYRLFSLMKKNATFINTGRGAQVVAQDLMRALKECPERTALLDVTDPTEPLAPDSEYWNYDNIYLTPHRAGSATDEIRRMGVYMFEEYERLINSKPVRYEVTLDMLATMS